MFNFKQFTKVIVRSSCLASVLAGCGQYDYSVNDRLVYGPSTLFKDYTLADTALEGCIRQFIEDNRISRAEDLKALSCTNAGIKDLEGLQQFTGLEQLKLSNNAIRNLVVLTRLASVQALWLDDNRIIDPVPLKELKTLGFLDLAGNDALQCPKPSQLAHVPELRLPGHCDSKQR